jgi:surface antigen
MMGAWQARVWDNGAILFTVPFTVTSTGTPTSGQTFPPPSVTTSQRTLPANVNGYPAYGAQAQVEIDGNYKANPFYDGGSWQCTRYVWGRAVEKTGVTLGFSGGSGNQNGGQWFGNVIAGGRVSLGSTARPNSIAVWAGGSDGNGHVAFVEDLNADGSLIVTEANYPTGSAPHQDTLSPTNPPGYQIATRDGGNGTSLILLGYIYLTTYEGYLDTSSNSCVTSVSGWVADHTELNTPLNVDIFDGENYLSSIYANGWRQDVANYLGNSGFNAFVYQLPPSTRDGQPHQIWARISGTYTDAAHYQSVSCATATRTANLQLTFSPNFVNLSQTCTFTFSGAETNGIGLNLTTLSIVPEGLTFNLPALGIPNRLDAAQNFSTGLSWCRAPGNSTFTISGTDDNGIRSSWSGTISFTLQ